ncbi:MAG: hypothetical protein ACXWIO_10150 [Croceibacterium sp.]
MTHPASQRWMDSRTRQPDEVNRAGITVFLMPNLMPKVRQHNRYCGVDVGYFLVISPVFYGLYEFALELNHLTHRQPVASQGHRKIERTPPLEATLLNKEADPARELKIIEECVLVAEKLVTHHWSLRRRSSISCSDKPGPPP